MKNDTPKRSYDYKTARLVVTIIVVAFAITASVCLYLLFREIIFGPNAVKLYIFDYNHRRFFPDYVYCIVVATISLYAFLFRTVGRGVIVRITYEEELARERLKFNTNRSKDLIVSLLLLVIALGFTYFGNTECVGFTDKEVIVPNPQGYTLEYSGLNVYQLEYISDSVGSVSDCNQEIAYVFMSGGKKYELPVLPTDSTEAEMLTAQIKKHHLKIIKVKTINDIPN